MQFVSGLYTTYVARERPEYEIMGSNVGLGCGARSSRVHFVVPLMR